MKGNTLSDFPDEKDHRRLKQYQISVVSDHMKNISQHSDPAVWSELTEIVLSRLLVFNARRGIQVAQLLVHHTRKLRSRLSQSYAASLSSIEQKSYGKVSLVLYTVFPMML